MLANQDVRNAVYTNGFKLWELAEMLGISDSSFSRQLRREFSPEKKQLIFRAIERMKERREEHDTFSDDC